MDLHYSDIFLNFDSGDPSQGDSSSGHSTSSGSNNSSPGPNSPDAVALLADPDADGPDYRASASSSPAPQPVPCECPHGPGERCPYCIHLETVPFEGPLSKCCICQGTSPQPDRLCTGLATEEGCDCTLHSACLDAFKTNLASDIREGRVVAPFDSSVQEEDSPAQYEEATSGKKRRLDDFEFNNTSKKVKKN